jgi:hypothetical protein
MLQGMAAFCFKPIFNVKCLDLTLLLISRDDRWHGQTLPAPAAPFLLPRRRSRQCQMFRFDPFFLFPHTFLMESAMQSATRSMAAARMMRPETVSRFAQIKRSDIDYWQGGPASVRKVPLLENQPLTPMEGAP